MKGSLRTIVVAMDNSNFSVAAAHWGAHLAASSGAHLLMVHVVDIRYVDGPWFADISGALGAAPYEQVVQNLSNAMMERGANILAVGKDIASQHKVEAETKLLKGLFVDVIREATEDANLLVLGRRGDDYSTGSHLLGTAGERAIREANCSCLIVPENYHAPAKIVVGVNSSGPARSARQWADYLHEVYPELVMRPLHVRDSSTDSEFEGETAGGVPVELLDGDPEEVLISETQDDPERTLCIIGATGHTRTLKELLLGTLTFHVLHKTKSPVLIAR